MNCKYTVIAAAISFSFMTFGCRHAEKNELAHDHSHEAAEEEHSDDKHSDDEIIVEPETAEKFGIKTTVIEPMAFSSGIQVTGQLLTPSSDEAVVSASTSGILTLSPSLTIGSKVSAGQQLGRIAAKSASGDDPNAMAKADIATAKREVERLKPLLDEGIITKADYNSALAAYERAKASFSHAAVAGTVKSPISGTITQMLANTGQFVETGTPLARIVQNRHLVLRVDLPEKYRSQLSSISGAEIRTATGDDWTALSELSGKKIDSNEFPVQTGYIPLFYSFTNNGNFSSGSFVEVNLTGTPGDTQIVIPVSSIIEQQGENYVYVKVGDHGYEKRHIIISGRSGDKVSVRSGLKTGDELVTEGATVVKMAEASGAVPEGHSHNH